MASDNENLSAVGLAIQWASRIITISIEMVVPGVLGHLLDRALGTPQVFAILGFVLGPIFGIWHLVRMVSPSPPRAKP